MAKPNVELRLARMRKGITQLELSELTGISNNKLSLWENGWRQPSQEEIQKIENALQTKINRDKKDSTWSKPIRP